MQIVKTITHKSAVINIVRVVKPGTKRVFFYPLTSDHKRLNRTLYARLWSAEELAKSYLKSIN